MDLIQGWFCINSKRLSFRAFRAVMYSFSITTNSCKCFGLFVHLSSLEMMLKAGTKYFTADIFALEQRFFPTLYCYWMTQTVSFLPLKMGTY